MAKITALTSGRKTYLAGLGLLCFGVYQFTTGDMNGAVQSALEGLSIIFLRAGIAKLG